MWNAPSKDPSSVADYGFDWEEWLDGDTLASSSWVITPAGTLNQVENNHTTTTTVVWLAQGTPGLVYEVTNSIVTAAGRREHRTLVIACDER